MVTHWPEVYRCMKKLLTASLVSELRSVKRICEVKCCWVCWECHTESHLECLQLHHYRCRASSLNGRLSLNCFQEEVQRKADLGRVLPVLSIKKISPLNWSHSVYASPFSSFNEVLSCFLFSSFNSFPGVHTHTVIAFFCSDHQSVITLIKCLLITELWADVSM